MADESQSVDDYDDDIEMNTEVSHSISLQSCASLFHFVTLYWACHFAPNFPSNLNPIYCDCGHDISSKYIFDMSRLRYFSSKIYQPIPFSIYFAQVISWARYINQSHFRYISLKYFLEQDISTNPIFDIFCSRNFLSEIYQPIPFSIYLVWVIIRARFINQSHFWYILLEYFLEQDISTNPIFDLSRSSNFLSEIYQPILFLIYLAWKISRARYINFLHFFIYLAQEISWARNFKNL